MFKKRTVLKVMEKGASLLSSISLATYSLLALPAFGASGPGEVFANGNGLEITKSVSKTDVYRDLPEDRLVEYEIEVENTEACDDAPIDAMLVLDRSGSMDDTDDPYCVDWDSGPEPTFEGWCLLVGGTWVVPPDQPLTDAQEAAKGFIDLLSSPADYAGLVSYATSATLDQGLTSNHAAVKTAIDGLSADGFTNIGQGLNFAHSEITNNGRQGSPDYAVPVVILLTDGKANVDDEGNTGDESGGQAYAEAEADLIDGDGIRIIVIGLGDDVNGSWLQSDIASTPDDYYFAPDSSDLATIFASIQASLGDSVDTVVTDDISDILLDADLLLNSIDGGGIYDGGSQTITWDLGTITCMDGNGSATLHFSVVVHSDAPDGDVMDNTANVTNLAGSDVDSNEVHTTIHALDKIDSDDPVVPGQIFTYTIDWATGDYAVDDVEIVDHLDTKVNYDSSNNGGVYAAGPHTVTWNLGPKAAHQSGTVTVDVEVTDPWPAATPLELYDWASIELKYSQIPDLDYDTQGDPGDLVLVEEYTDVESFVDLSIEKSDDPDPVQAGGELTYTVTVVNDGSATQTASGYVLIENYDPNTTFVSSVPPPDAGDNQWNVPDLAPGESFIVEITVEVDSPLDDGTLLLNEACLEGTDICKEEETEVDSWPELHIQKGDDVDPVDADGNLVYSIEYWNSGNMTAHNVVITESYDPNVTFVSANPAPDVGDNEWQIGDLEPDTHYFIEVTVSINTPIDDETLLLNEVCIDSDEDGTCGDEETEVNSWVDLIVEKEDDPDPVQAGGTLIYTVTVTNSPETTMTASGYELHEIYDPRTTFVSANPAADIPNHHWFIPDLDPGEFFEVEITVEVDSPLDNGSVLENTVCIFGTDNCDTEETTVESAPDLEIVKIDDPDPVTAGEQLGYQITYENVGNMNAYDVWVEETYDPNVTFVSANPSPDVGDNLWSIGTLPPNIQGVIEVTVEVDMPLVDGTLLENLVEIYEEEGDFEDDTELTEVESEIDLQFEKLDDVDPVEAGGTLTYSLTFENVGTMTAEDISIVDTLPAEVTYVPGSSELDGSPIVDPAGINPYTWDLGMDLVPNEPHTLTFEVTVDTPMNDGETLLNESELFYTDPSQENGELSEFADEITEVNSAPVLELLKTDDPDPVEAGQVVTYTITYENTGNMNASAVQIIDTLPAGVTYVLGSSEIDGAPVGDPDGTNPYTWDLATLLGDGTLAPDGPHTLTFDVLIGETVADGTVVTDSATVTGTYLEQLEIETNVSASDTEDTTVVTPVLSITKVNDSPDAGSNPGDTITFTVAVTNSGGADAAGVTIIDTLPAGITYVAGSSTLNGVSVGDPAGANPYTWSVGTLPANGGSSTLTYDVTVDADATAGAYSNNTFADADNTLDPTDSVTSTFTVVIPAVLGEEIEPEGEVLGATGEAAYLGMLLGILMLGFAAYSVRKKRIYLSN